MKLEKDRRDKCKCGKFISWDPYSNDDVVCKHCGAKYSIECDSVLVYWLYEKHPQKKKWQTEAR